MQLTRARLIGLLVLGFVVVVMAQQFVVGDRRYEGIQDFSRAAAMIPAQVTTAPSGACNLVGRVVVAADTGLQYRCASDGNWAPFGGSGGASGVTQMKDFVATRTSGTLMTFSSDASATAPQQIAVGQSLKTVTAPWTATIASGTASGTVYVYLDAADMDLKVGHNTANTITCSGCTTVTSLAAFPTTAVPLYVLTMTTGAWDSLAASMDKRAMIARGQRLIAGSNVTLTEAAGAITISAAGGSSALDLTELTEKHDFAASGYASNPQGGWALASPQCGGPGFIAATANYPSAPAFSGAACAVYYPAGNTSSALPASFHGGTPKPFTAVVHGGRSNAGTGDIYWGISGAVGNVDNFVGVRFNNTGSTYSCVIRSAGADVTAASLAATVDTLPHRISVSNGGTANSVTCQHDALTATTVTGTIPTMTAPVFFAGFTPGASTNFSVVTAGIRITGLSR